MPQFDPRGDFFIDSHYERSLVHSLQAVQEAMASGSLDTNAGGEPDADFWETARWARPYVVKNGILRVPVVGILLHRFPYSFGSMATGYEYIRQALRRGLSDDQVKGIVLDVDSPGGMVSGCFDLADELFEAREEKPTMAVVQEHAYSAGYALASSASEIVVARTGGVGSIGVLGTHVDMSEALKDRGLKFTFITAGEGKEDGRPELPLSDKAKAEMQKRVDSHYQIFVSTVARNRSIEDSAIRKFGAKGFVASESVEAGLTDKIGSFDDAMAAFAVNLNMPKGDDFMAEKDNAVDQAAHNKAVEDARAEGKRDGLAEGARAERERVQTILGSDEAAKNPQMAQFVALESDFDVDKAKAFLAKAPAAEAPANPEAAAPSGFDSAMERSGNPDLGAANRPDDGAETVDVADRIFASAGLASK